MQKTIIATAVIFVGLVLGTIFWVWPRYQSFNATRMEIEKSQLEMADKQEYFSELRNISSRLKDYGEEFSKIDSSLSASLTEPELINFVSRIVSESGLILGNVNLSGLTAQENNSQLKKISMDMTVVGFYPALKNLLVNFEKSAKIMEVDSISFSSPAEGETFSFNLKVHTYSY
jgi:Tfp pilus assembly protein PilO